VRVFATRVAAETLHVYRQLDHRNIVTALEAFTTDSRLYIVLEHMPLSLEQIVRSPAYPNERQLAAILGQVSSRISAESIRSSLQVVTGECSYAALESLRLKPERIPRSLRPSTTTPIILGLALRLQVASNAIEHGSL
jgi:hypothetical protein